MRKVRPTVHMSIGNDGHLKDVTLSERFEARVDAYPDE